MLTKTFKRLFEVRFLHEFYLADRDQEGMLFFDKTPSARRTYLEQLILQGRYNILRDLEIEPTPETAIRMRGRQMKIGRNATGFFVGAEVEAVNSGGTTYYKPRQTIEPGFRLSFFIRVRNPLFRAFTALRLRQPASLSAFYFFSNARKTPSGSGFPSLSEAPPEFAAGTTYEPGELVSIGGNLYEAVAQTQTTAAASWAPAGGEGYVTERDRRALPKQFPWNWTGPAGPVTFILTNEAGAEIKKIETTVTENSRRIPLNFARQVNLSDGSPAAVIPDGYYSLEVQGSGYNMTVPVFLHGELSGGAPSGPQPGGLFSTSNLLGLVDIIQEDSGSALPYLNAQGFIQQIPLSGGGTSHPVFEARFLSRSAWWRYRSDRDQTLQALNEAALFLDQSDKDLVTKQARRFFTFPQGFIQTPGSPPVWLPNPPPDALRPAPDGRLFAETLVSKIPNLITTS